MLASLMDFNELEAFVVLARTLHFARAAATVHTSPSGLSRLIGRLEDELGVKLLSRDTRRVSLTEEGEAFLQFAETSVHSRDELRLRLDSREGKLRGSLRVYASVTACYSILPPFAEALHLDHPELRLSVETGDPAGAEGTIRDGRAELAVAALPPGGFPDLACFSVRNTPLVLASSKSGPYGSLDLELDGAAGTAETTHASRLVRTLSSVPLILPQSGLARVRFDRWAKARGIKPHIAAEAAGNEAVLALARLGLGLCLVPRLVLENGPFAEGLVLYAAGADFGEYDIGFVFKQGKAAGNAAIGSAIASLVERVYPEGTWRRRWERGAEKLKIIDSKP
jgi:LysR family transcriptional regulator, positive regulator for ilvC